MKVNRENEEPIIIAEVGQNHQGELEEALKYIQVFSRSGATVIKFQTRNNKYLFSEDAYQKEYNSENAFAKTCNRVYNITDKKELAKFTYHSIRVGACVALHAAGEDGDLIKFWLRWRSDSFRD